MSLILNPERLYNAVADGFVVQHCLTPDKLDQYLYGAYGKNYSVVDQSANPIASYLHYLGYSPETGWEVTTSESQIRFSCGSSAFVLDGPAWMSPYNQDLWSYCEAFSYLNTVSNNEACSLLQKYRNNGGL